MISDSTSPTPPIHKTESSLSAAQPEVVADGLSAAHAAHLRADVLKRSSQRWLWALAALLLINLFLWFSYTKTRAVWGSSQESAALPAIAGDRISASLETATSTEPKNSFAPVAPQKKNADVKAGDCMVWAFTNDQEGKRASIRLNEQGWAGYTLEQAPEPPTFMVFVGPYAQPQQIASMIKTLLALKIKQYSILPSGSISLGVVSNLDSAKQLQRQLSSRGLKDIDIVERPGKVQRGRLRFEGLSAPSMKALTALSEGLGVLSDCPAALP